MAMNDEETVALVAGGHTFGKAHGAATRQHVGPEPEGAPIEEQGLGWKQTFGTGKGGDTITSGIEGAWTSTPTTGTTAISILFGYDWELTKSPAGAHQWTPRLGPKPTWPGRHDPSKTQAPMMTTADMALKMDPIYGPISKRFHENPAEFADAFARAWFKLTHRDMGPRARYLGTQVPAEELIWQDPIPAALARRSAMRTSQHSRPRSSKQDCRYPSWSLTAWASAATYRGSDMRGGANGARVRLAPQKDWEANDPAKLANVLAALEGVQKGCVAKTSRWPT